MEQTDTRTALEIAAPYLLAACKVAYAELTYLRPFLRADDKKAVDAIIPALRAALAKAEGGAA